MKRYEKYDPEVLNHLQKTLLMMLKDIGELCDENGIEYYAYAGTAIGAVRHEGFIPWDDDMDIFMTHENYEKFKEIITKKSDKYDFISIENTEDYFLLFSKVMLKGTNFDEWWAKQVNFTTGIFVDIFPLYKLPKSNIKRFIHLKKIRILDRLISASILRYEGYPKFQQIPVNIIHYLLKVFHITPKFLKKKCLKHLKKYENTDSTLYVDVCGNPDPHIFYKDELEPSKKVKFETIEIPLPDGNDRILKMMYGDYMRLPPEEERFNHVVSEIDFGKY